MYVQVCVSNKKQKYTSEASDKEWHISLTTLEKICLQWEGKILIRVNFICGSISGGKGNRFVIFPAWLLKKPGPVTKTPPHLSLSRYPTLYAYIYMECQWCTCDYSYTHMIFLWQRVPFIHICTKCTRLLYS